MRDRYVHGVPCWIDTAQPDPDAAIRFYGALFGWEFETRDQDRVARLDGKDVAAITPQADDAGSTPVWTTYIRVGSAVATAASVVSAGGHVVREPVDVHGFVFEDPSGATFSVMEEGGAELVNAPGTWNWSNLESAYAGGAEAFYGAVFGWEATAMGEGTLMWRLPGYGDLLAERDPALRARHAEPGVPAGFSDAVAWLVPPSRGAPPHWSVTFAVDDTDAVARRASELGGTVLVPPYDVDGARVAVLRDPQGAELTVNSFRLPGE
jgi:predicted enzyme related to lactoylglutathione lyase